MVKNTVLAKTTFNRPRASEAVALDIFKPFDRLWHVGPTNLSLTDFHVRYLALFFLASVIDSCEWFWIGSFHKYSVNAGVPQGSILGPTLSYYT